MDDEIIKYKTHIRLNNSMFDKFIPKDISPNSEQKKQQQEINIKRIEHLKILNKVTIRQLNQDIRIEKSENKKNKGLNLKQEEIFDEIEKSLNRISEQKVTDKITLQLEKANFINNNTKYITKY